MSEPTVTITEAQLSSALVKLGIQRQREMWQHKTVDTPDGAARFMFDYLLAGTVKASMRNNVPEVTQ